MATQCPEKNTPLIPSIITVSINYLSSRVLQGERINTVTPETRQNKSLENQRETFVTPGNEYPIMLN